MAIIRRSVGALFITCCLTVTWGQQTDPGKNQVLRQQIQAALEAQRANRLDEAAAGFQAVISQVPSLAEAHMSLGLVRHQQQRYGEAIPELETALRLKPALKDARAVLGLAYLQAGQPAKALEHLEKTVQDDPENAEASGWLGMAYLNTGQARQAIPKLEKAIQASPGNEGLLSYLVRAYAASAAQVRSQLSQQARNSVQAHVALAESYAGCENSARAATEYNLAAKIDPNQPGINAALGDLLMGTGDYEASEKAYEKELRLTPALAATQFRYGRVLAELGRSQEALPYLKKASELDPSSSETFFYLGKAYFDLEQFREAEEPFVKALEGKLPEHDRLMSAHYQLGMVYQKLGKAAQAEQHLEAFKKLQAEAGVTGQK